MPGQNKHPLIGGHVPSELGAWARAEAERRNVPLVTILTEALEAYRAAVESRTVEADGQPAATVPAVAGEVPAYGPGTSFGNAAVPAVDEPLPPVHDDPAS